MAYSLQRSRWPVLVLLIGFAVASCTSTHSTPRASSPHTTAPVSGSNPAPGGPGGGRNGVVAGRAVGPWKATTVGGAIGHAKPLAGTHRSLYLRDNRELVRVDVATGRAEARKRMGSTPGRLLIVGGLVWDIPSSTSSGRLLLVGLNPMTLDRIKTVSLPGVGPPGQLIGSAADARGQRLYVGVGKTIFVVGTRRRHLVARYLAPGPSISALALSPNRTRLYVTWNIPNGARSGLAALDPRTGAALAGPVLFYGGSTVSSVSAGGVWLANGQGMTQTLTFHPADNLAQRIATAATYAGGGWIVDSTVDDDVVWIGGTTTLACADPLTGRVRARTKVPTPHRDAAVEWLRVNGPALLRVG